MNGTVYIAGPMSGIKFLNYPAFDVARDELTAAGCNVISPADLGRDAGYDATALPEDTDWSNAYPGIDMDEVIAQDVDVILNRADAVALIANWADSTGARAEKALAEWKKLELMYRQPDGTYSHNRTQPVPVPCGPVANPKQACGDAKLPLHLWPTSATMYGCVGMLNGALSYGRSNFREAPILASTYFSAICRHLFAWWEGEDVDPVDKVPHLSALLANPAIIVDAMTHGRLIDDRSYRGMPAYREVCDELTKHVARLKKLHESRSPTHYSALTASESGTAD